MRVDYGGWSSLDISEVLLNVPKEFHEEIRSTLENMMFEVYEQGVEEGKEQHASSEDLENLEWVEQCISEGELDVAVSKRAHTLGFVNPIDDIDDFRQLRHRELHPDGVWGWEYCTRC